MAEGKFQVLDMKGLTPGVDPTVSREIFALGGRNYVFDSKGVKSPFGNRAVSLVPLENADHIQGVRLRITGGDRTFWFVRHGIIEWDEDLGGWRTVFVTPDTANAPYRWTFEYLNGYLYFAHPAVGILVLNVESNYCAPHEEVGIGTPEQVLAISQNNGRLGVLTTTTLSWSAPSNGLNFTPALGQAGAQVVAERIAGDPIMLTSHARGFLTWTTGGVMRSEFTGDKAVFRHRTLQTEYRPINSFCTARVDEDTVIILDERGLFRSRGDQVSPFAPIFNEFLIGFMQERDYNVGQAVRIEWDDLQRRLYLSYSDSYANPIYEKCFVYYPPLDKWGEFNESHYGILPLKIGDSERADDYFGFVDGSRVARYWLGTGSRQKSVADSTGPETANLYIPEIEKPAQAIVGEEGRIVSAYGKLRGFDATLITQIEGYYTDGASVPQVPELTGLNSLVKFGLFRLTGEQAADEVSEITSVVIRNVISGESDVLTEDFMLVPDGTSDEDYQAIVGEESVDLGIDPLNYINHTFELVGTKDGDTDWVRQTPELVDYDRAARYFACTVPGVWHIAEIGAESVGEVFHVKTFELTGTSQGRLL